jgi:hypothetical protein
MSDPSVPVVAFPKVVPKERTQNPYLKQKKPEEPVPQAATEVKRHQSPPVQPHARTSSDAPKHSKARAESPPTRAVKIPVNFDADQPDDDDFDPDASSDDESEYSRRKRKRSIEESSESEAEETDEAEEVDEIDEEEEAREVAKLKKVKREESSKAAKVVVTERDKMTEDELKTRPTGLAKTCASWTELEDKITAERLSLVFEERMCGRVKAATTDDTRAAKAMYETCAANVASFVADIKKIVPWMQKHGRDTTRLLGGK